jgi:hypothetical protein
MHLILPKKLSLPVHGMLMSWAKTLTPWERGPLPEKLHRPLQGC